jgi:pilus assembly protein CpaF
MFTVVIHEKGGTERREAFDRGDISVGRVQGNDLMLPKGNVSKHHARLLLRDARFIVTDLKSTNGTYVNGRKISQATIVREGDKIYIGDFVLRLESTGQESAPAQASPAAASAPAIEPGSSPGSGPSLPPVSMPSPSLASAAEGPRTPELQNVSHFPLERDPDSESAPEMRGIPIPVLPRPPRLPQRLDTRPRVSTAAMPADRLGTQYPPPVAPPAPGSPRRTAPSLARSVSREGPQQSGRRLALIALVDRVADAVDLTAMDDGSEVRDAQMDEIERAVRDQARAMRVEGEAPDDLDLEVLSRDAMRELVDVGPFGPLLDDETVSAIHVGRPDHVAAIRSGQTLLVEPGFTSEMALRRAVARLASRAGDPLAAGEQVVDRRLPRGARIVAMGPPIAPSWVVTIRKPRRFESSFEDLIHAGALSRPMATFLEACASARANVLVMGPGLAVIGPVLAALVATVPAAERVVLLEDEEAIAVPHAQGLALRLPLAGPDAERAFLGAARLGGDRTVVASLAGAVAAAALDAIADGAEGLFGGVGAPSMRQGLARLAAHVALARPGSSIEVAREAVGVSFHVAIEVGRTVPDGRLRVLRIAELLGADSNGVAVQDLFVSNPAAAAAESAFIATGNTPKVALDFAARGVELDSTLFQRAP